MKLSTISLLAFIWACQLVATEARIGGSQVRRKLDDEELTRLVNVGNNLGPSANLGLCEGDCDNDDECAEGLVCFQRTQYEEVPGCTGSLNTENDYCIVATLNAQTDPPAAAPAIETAPPTVAETEIPDLVTDVPDDNEGDTGAPTEAMTTVPATSPPVVAADVPETEPPTVAETEVDDEPDVTDVPALPDVTTAPSAAATVPTMPLTSAPTMEEEAPETAPPTMIATEVETEVETLEETEAEVPDEDSETGAPTEDIQVEDVEVIWDTLPLVLSGNNGDFDVYPLSACMGDCDSNDDCAGDLVCYQRETDNKVPGCSGEGAFSIDYCADPRAVAAAAAAASSASKSAGNSDLFDRP